MEPSIKKRKRDSLVRNAVIVVLIVLLISESAVLVHDFHTTGPIQQLRVRDRNQQHVQIEQWMTFRYINTLFALPPAYLQSTLEITDIHYPDIEIRHYAKTHHIDTLVFTNDLQRAATNYEAP